VIDERRLAFVMMISPEAAEALAGVDLALIPVGGRY